MPFQTPLRSTLHSFYGPVTALTAWSQKVLVGCGNEISIYCLRSLRLETRQQILNGACIHGFSKGEVTDDEGQLVCAYGAKQARIIALKSNGDFKADLLLLSDIVHLPDWIWEARWMKDMELNSPVAFALAHNTVALWDWKTNQMVERQECQEKCILYCAHFIGDMWSQLVLAAGTVFNQVVLWLVTDNNQTSQGLEHSAAPVMHTLSGHKGVIFSIRYHAQHQHLCSVSDDRSIRMWQIDFPGGQTSSPSADDWRGMTSSLLLSVFGHSARVFDAVLLTRCFASVGEDATCCVWDYSGQVITTFKGHKGKCIWSVCATSDEQHILTGGGDGSVRKWRINTEQDKSPAQKVLDVSKLFPVDKDDFPRTVTLLDFDTVLIMMNSGSLYSYSMRMERFDCVMRDARFASYSVVSPCPDKTKIAVASIGGIIRVLELIPGALQAPTSIEKTLFGNKILAVVWVSHDRLVVSGQNGVCIADGMGASDMPVLHAVRESSLFLPVAKHRWVSAACLITTSSSESDTTPNYKLLACGDKDGSIYLYQLSVETTRDDELIQPRQSFHKIHGKNGVTHMTFQDGVVYSVGRDGCCRHWEMEGGQLVLQHGSKVVKGFEWIERLERSKDDLMFYGFFSTQFVIWSQRYNQKMFYVECGGGHRSWGCCHDNDGAFRFAYLKGGVVNVVDSAQCSRHEILKPPLHGREIHDVKLLGMTQLHSLTSSFLTFIASEDTSITVGSYYHMGGFVHWKPLATLKGHLSNVRAIAVLEESQERSDHHSQTEASSRGEDASCDKKDNQRDFILFTGGGRAEIRVWKVRVGNTTRNAISCDKSGHSNDRTKNVECSKLSESRTLDKDVQPDSSVFDCSTNDMDTVTCTHQEWSTHYLGESRHKRPFSKWKTRKLCLDPETRVMSIEATSVRGIESVSQCFHNECLHIVSAAGSDGILRVFCYNEGTRKLHPVTQSAFHQGCVLKVLHFHFKSTLGSLFLAFSTSTNGQIAVWSMDRVVRKAVDIENDVVSKLRHSEKDKSRAHTENSTSTSESLTSGHSKELGVGATEDSETTQIDAGNDFDDEDAEDFRPLTCLPAHQSGINSIHALQVNDTSFILASGGDDNALTVQLIKVKGLDMKVECRASNRTAHCAQITGLRIVSDNVVVSISIDQRICVWGLDMSSGDLKMELLSCSYIYLADVSCMDVCVIRNAVYLCLGGEGLCLYSWDGEGRIGKDGHSKDGTIGGR